MSKLQVAEHSSTYTLRAAAEPAFGGSFDLLATAPRGVTKLRELVVRFASAGLLDDQEGSTTTSLLGRVAEFVMGQAPPGSACNKDAVGTVFVKTGEFGDLYPQVREWTTQPLKFAQRGDVLICVVGATIGKLNLAIDSAIGRSVAAIRPGSNLTTKYLYYMLMPFTLSLRRDSRGSAQGVIGKSELSAIRIRVPPLAEQARIVARVEELMQLCDALEAHGRLQDEQHARLVATLFDALAASESADALAENWQRIATHFDLLLDRPEAVDTLEQTLLQLAVRGLLVPQDPTDEPASELLTRIRVEKDRLIAEGKSKRAKPSPPIADEERPFEVPTGWEWVRVGSVGVTQTGGTPSSNKPEYFDGNFPFIGPGQITPGGEILPPEKVISELGRFESAVAEPGDILMVCIGGSIGKCAAASFATAFNQQINSLHPLLASSEFILTAMTASDFVSAVVSTATGSATPIISKGKWDLLLLPIPPLAEQHRIVARVEQIRRLCANLRERLQQSRTTQSYLADALVSAAAQSPAC